MNLPEFIDLYPMMDMSVALVTTTDKVNNCSRHSTLPSGRVIYLNRDDLNSLIQNEKADSKETITKSVSSHNLRTYSRDRKQPVNFSILYQANVASVKCNLVLLLCTGVSTRIATMPV